MFIIFRRHAWKIHFFVLFLSFKIMAHNFFQIPEMSFHCLGDWEGGNGQRYVALMDTQATTQNEDDIRPRYRCAVSDFIIFEKKRAFLILSGSHFF